MKLNNLMKSALSLVLALMTILFTGCGEKDNNDDNKEPTLPGDQATLVVSAESVELTSAADASKSFTITTTAAWTAVAQGDGFSLNKTSGMGNAEIQITATAANTASTKTLGKVVISAVAVAEAKTVVVKQLGTGTNPDPTPDPDPDPTPDPDPDPTPDPDPDPTPDPDPDPAPGTQTILIDFTKGINVATPALPNQKAEAKSGAFTYTIEGYAFEVYTDATLGGTFYWIDNTVFQENTAKEPNKGLYINKLGAYIKFPAITGKALSEVSYTATTNETKEIEVDLMGANGEENTLYNFENGIYKMIDPATNTAYRLEVTNSKAMQIALLKLVYIDAK